MDAVAVTILIIAILAGVAGAILLAKGNGQPDSKLWDLGTALTTSCVISLMLFGLQVSIDNSREAASIAADDARDRAKEQADAAREAVQKAADEADKKAAQREKDRQAAEKVRDKEQNLS